MWRGKNCWVRGGGHSRHSAIIGGGAQFSDLPQRRRLWRWWGGGRGGGGGHVGEERGEGASDIL